MAEDSLVETPSGVQVPVGAVITAEELAALVRAATHDLPFGAEPAAFLTALERLARVAEEAAA
ncbi:hypothetical protein [Benzoatithermus flavus]|uniref:Uncharacterized protein n=1 Tax=Benzoatithermus flavus TaxID=3108223 RepID=A0ABU8XNL7_9PROT